MENNYTFLFKICIDKFYKWFYNGAMFFLLADSRIEGKMAGEVESWVDDYEDSDHEDLEQAEWNRFMHAEEIPTAREDFIVILPWIGFCLLIGALLFWIFTG